MKHAQKVKKRYLTILNDMAKNRDSYVKNPEKDFTRKRKIMNKQKWQHEHFLNAFFTNSQQIWCIV